MKLLIQIKDPDAIADATLGLGAKLRNLAAEHLAWMFVDAPAGEKFDDIALDVAHQRLNKWAHYGEYFVVEIDLARDTARIVPTSEARVVSAPAAATDEEAWANARGAAAGARQAVEAHDVKGAKRYSLALAEALVDLESRGAR